jgi:hypothetical protein
MNHVAEAVRQIRGTSPNQVPDVQLHGDRYGGSATRGAAHGRVHRRHLRK